MTATVLLCLDGGDLRVVQSLAARGGMPATQRLLERSALVHMETTGDVLELPVWTSLLSGQPVGNDPLSHFELFDPATMGTTFRREGLLEPLWLHLPAAGRGALVLDPPEVHPHPRSAAVASCCWHVHGPVHAPVFTDRGLSARLRARGRPPRLKNATQLGPDIEPAIAGQLERSVEYRIGTLEALGFERPFTCVGVYELHTALHGLGHHGPDEHWLDGQRRDPGLLARPYEAIDRLIGRVVELAGPANIVLVLARGIRPANHCGHLLEGLLERAGLLVRRLAIPAGANGSSTRAWLTERARGLLPDATREQIAMHVLPVAVQQRLAAQRFRDRYAWEQTRVFPPPSWGSGQLRMNLAGREVAGIVAPREAEALLAEVTEVVNGMVDADTGRALVEEVIRARERFPGARTADLPDLILRWTVGRPPRAARHPQLGTWATPPRSLWTEHRAGADVLFAGPDARRGVRIDGDPLGLAPTVLALLGSRAPTVMPGAVWRDVLAG